MIEPGTPAPDFTLPNHRGEQVSLADFRGRKLVLCFYPNDFSPVCSDQLSIYQEVLGEIRERGAELVGISTDGSWAPQRVSQAPRARDHAALGLPPQGRGLARLRRLPRGLRARRTARWC